MKAKNVKNLGVLALMTATSLTVMAYYPDYIVKKGDTLSAIALAKLSGGALYGNEGRLAKLLLLNPSIKNPNLIEPGTEIKLRASVADLDAKIEKVKTIATKSIESNIEDQAKLTQAAPERKSFDYLLTEKKKAKNIMVKLGAGIAFNSLDLVDNITKDVDSISSSSSLTATAEGKYLINENSLMTVKVQLSKMKLRASGNETAISTSTTFLSGELGADYKVSSQFLAGLRVGAVERAFVTQKRANTFLIDKSIIPTIGPELRLLLDENETTASSVLLGYRFLGSTTLNGLQIQNGQEIRTGFELMSDTFNFNPYVNWSRQNTALLDQDGLALGININFKL
jgi:LysM repeat protein